MDKHQRLAAIRSGKFQVQSVESDEVKVWVFNDVAFVTDRERIRMKQGHDCPGKKPAVAATDCS
jgi:hypothetical protein